MLFCLVVVAFGLMGQIAASGCDPNPCLNGGTCDEIDGSCTCSAHYTGTQCETAGDDFLYWTESFTGQTCPWDNSLTTCAKCRAGGVQCPYHTTPNVCVMDGEYSQNLFCCHSLGLYSTCDNEMWLYADGEEIGHLGDWSLSIFRQIQSDVTVVAIKCLDWGGYGAVLASFSDGTTSSPGTWTCSKVATEGWTSSGFTEDSDWVTPESLGKHPIPPWNTVAGMSRNAEWIWYPGQTQDSPVERTVYCRSTLAWGQLASCEAVVNEVVGTLPPTTTTSTTVTTTTTPIATTTTPIATTTTTSIATTTPAETTTMETTTMETTPMEATTMETTTMETTAMETTTMETTAMETTTMETTTMETTTMETTTMETTTMETTSMETTTKTESTGKSDKGPDDLPSNFVVGPVEQSFDNDINDAVLGGGIAAALACLVLVSCCMIYAGIRRRRRKQQKEEEKKGNNITDAVAGAATTVGPPEVAKLVW